MKPWLPGLLGLVVVLLVPAGEAAFDTHETGTGAKATASYPDSVNARDSFHVTVNADAGNGGINAFPTAPTGWTFVGCTFASVDVNQVASSHKAQAVKLTMTDDTCTFYVEVIWQNSVGQQNAATTVQGSIVVDDPVWSGDFLAVLVWLAYAYLTLQVRIREMALVAAALGLVITLLPVGALEKTILGFGQLALLTYLVVEYRGSGGWTGWTQRK